MKPWAERRRYPSWQFTNQPPIVAVALSAPRTRFFVIRCHSSTFVHCSFISWLVTFAAFSIPSDSTRLVQQLCFGRVSILRRAPFILDKPRFGSLSRGERRFIELYTLVIGATDRFIPWDESRQIIFNPFYSI